MSRRLPPDPSEAIGTAIVKYNYQAQQPDELSLTKGTRILILEKSNDGWWRGQSGNSVGWFPSNYTTEDCDNDGEIHTYAMAENVLDIVVSILPPTPQGVNISLNLSLPSSFLRLRRWRSTASRQTTIRSCRSRRAIAWRLSIDPPLIRTGIRHATIRAKSV